MSSLILDPTLFYPTPETFPTTITDNDAVQHSFIPHYHVKHPKWYFDDADLFFIGCNTGTGNSAVSQQQVPQVRVRFRNLGPEAVPQPVTAVSQVFVVLSVHCRPKSRSVNINTGIKLSDFLRQFRRAYISSEF